MEANNVVLWAKEDAVCFVLRCIDGDGPEFDEGRPVPPNVMRSAGFDSMSLPWRAILELARARFFGLKKRAYLQGPVDTETQTTLASRRRSRKMQKKNHIFSLSLELPSFLDYCALLLLGYLDRSLED